MAGRKRKQGLEYSSWDVDVYDDRKILSLTDSEGYGAFTVYFVLCQQIYASGGYYLPWTEGDVPWMKRLLGGGITSEKVAAVVERCLQIGLFDQEIYRKYGVLTSRGIQRTFAIVVQKRRCRDVIRELWLLSPEESGGATLVPAEMAGAPQFAGSK